MGASVPANEPVRGSFGASRPYSVTTPTISTVAPSSRSSVRRSRSRALKRRRMRRGPRARARGSADPPARGACRARGAGRPSPRPPSSRGTRCSEWGRGRDRITHRGVGDGAEMCRRASAAPPRWVRRPRGERGGARLRRGRKLAPLGPGSSRPRRTSRALPVSAIRGLREGGTHARTRSKGQAVRGRGRQRRW
jgi:hypothetical protein